MPYVDSAFKADRNIFSRLFRIRESCLSLASDTTTFCEERSGIINVRRMCLVMKLSSLGMNQWLRP